MNVTFSATDFIYAVVVGAAFQRIAAPDLSLNNLLLLVAFAVIIDDWVLYHAETAQLGPSVHESPLRLVLDLIILLIWYWGAMAAAQGATGFASFALLLFVFYVATAIWEVIFYRQKSKIRLSIDTLCAAYVGILALSVLCGIVPSSSLWSVATFFPVILFRVPLWQRVLKGLP
jgi:hypothetical protein